mmetsp:Transcript_23863/g.51556  ORF Transcript_23863/g.51556 Transcript_23863/m.51556 type:complete len:249 (+) Transcript_23863:288-1034(+)
MAPRGNSGSVPISSLNGSHNFGGIDEFFVGFDGDEVWVSPFFIQESQITLFLLIKWYLPVIPLTPSGHHKLSPRLQYSHHLINVSLLVRHVLPTLTRPHNIKRIIRKIHLQRVHDHELGIVQSPFLRQFRPTLHLIGTQCNPRNIRLGSQFIGQIPTRTTKTTTHIQHLGIGIISRINLTKFHHLIDKIILGLNKILFLVSRGHFLLVVITKVDVLSPVVFEDAICCPRVVFAGYGIGTVRSGRTVED